MAAVTTAAQTARRFDQDPRRSAALPGRFYHDPEIYRRELEAIFYKGWLYGGHVSALAEPGAYLTREIGCESIVLLRGRDREVRGFYNVCQHRAHRLLEGEGALKSVITCPYHAWTYGLDGALRTARGTEKLTGFEAADFCLTPVKVELLGGFIFFNLDPEAQSLSERLGDFEAEFRSFDPNPERLVRAYRKELEVQANWKNVIENYAECYHCPISHVSLSNNALDMGSYRIKVHPAYHVHTSGDCGADQGYSYSPEAAARGRDFASWLIFPNLVFEYYPGGKLTVFHNHPLGPERTLQIVEWYLPAETPSAEEQEVIDFVDVVREEDIPIVESVQQGLHSRGYRRGRFVVDEAGSGMSEHAVHDFPLKVLTALGIAPGEEETPC